LLVIGAAQAAGFETQQAIIVTDGGQGKGLLLEGSGRLQDKPLGTGHGVAS
jgi:hypothetical protein